MAACRGRRVRATKLVQHLARKHRVHVSARPPPMVFFPSTQQHMVPAVAFCTARGSLYLALYHPALAQLTVRCALLVVDGDDDGGGGEPPALVVCDAATRTEWRLCLYEGEQFQLSPVAPAITFC
jgi:hypothetical protein